MIASKPTQPKMKRKSTLMGVMIALLIGGYSTFRPAINEATGWNLPAFTEPRQDEPRQDEPNRQDLQPTSERNSASMATTAPEAEARSPTETASRKTESLKTQPRETQSPMTDAGAAKPSGPLADRVRTGAPTEPASSGSAAGSADPSLKYGLLREIGPDRFISPAGLLYTPGSAEGHRLEHLRRHTVDMPGRPGKHGVFDGGMEAALATIDKAYENAKANRRTSKETDQGRTIYRVDMGKRVGYVGGREGNSKRKPMARRVQLVLEGNRVITAYPL